MKRTPKKTFNLADRKEIMELMKQLYGDDVQDDQKICNTNRETGTESFSQVDELSSST